MCGIAGIVNFFKRNDFDIRQISLMTDALKHRGPDGEGFVFFSEKEIIKVGGKDTPQNIFNSTSTYSPQHLLSQLPTPNSHLAFGHRRLSIIDLSPAGHQPMCSKDEKIWITYNGEIYNYIELREELKTKGYQFQTNTDTEVIIYAYSEWGEKCLEKFNGMWSFVIFDRKKNILFGSRDRFGVKPFYYFKNENYFAFASEQKALLQLKFIPKEINRTAVFDYFVFNKTEMEEEGIFKNIFELLPSHSFILNLNNNDFRKWRYYSLPINLHFENFQENKFHQHTEKIKELIEQAIALRLRSDVTVGSCLSGGLDSSTIVCVVNDLLKNNFSQYSNQIGERQKVFTSSFQNEKIDESKWAKSVIEQTKTSWFQTFPNAKNLFNDLEHLHYSQDIPLWSTSTFAQHSVMKLAKENGVKVLLDGQGGDELFAGYPHHFPVYWNELLGHFHLGKFFQEYFNYEMSANRFSFLLKNYLKNNWMQKIPFDVYKKIHPEINFLNPDILNENKNRIEWFYAQQANSLNETLSKEFYNSQMKTYLKCEDRCSMWHSVESRTPFADDINLIEYVFQIPSSYKIKNGASKYLLREAFGNILPEKIKNRKDKMGYVTPNNQWIREIKNEVKPYFTNDLKDYLDIDLLMKNYDDFFNPKTDVENYRIFKFISFAVWKKVFNL